MMLRQKPVIVSVAAVLAVLGSARVASAGECVADEDCGHGFECEVQPDGTAGTGSGGGSSGGTGGGSSGGAAGGSSGGTQGFAPPRDVTCGDGLCQVTESADTCAADCLNTICALAVCETSDDCAEGYECADEPVAGTGGAAGSTCGDGLCTSGETRETCAEDCTATRRCTPAGGICSSDAQCPDGFYCSFLGSGSGGFGGTGSAVGGSAGTSSAGTSFGGTTGGTGAGSDAALAAGTCMPRDDGAGGTLGSGGTAGGDGAGTGGTAFGGSGALGTGGTGTGAIGGTGGTGTGGTGAIAGTAGMEGGTSGSTGGSTSSGGNGSGGTGSGGTGNGSGGTGNASGSGGNASGEDPGAAERGGCSVASGGGRSAFAELGALLLAGLVALRRRRS